MDEYEFIKMMPEASWPYSDAKPSEVTDVYWIDEVWAKIKKAVEEGKLGCSAKVATAKPNPHATKPNKHVICVYTYDYTDEQDVRRVRDELRHLGINARIPYKADEDTLSGKYQIRGHTKISKYFE